MRSEIIWKRVESLREQMADMKEKERELIGQARAAEDAESMKILKKNRITPAQLKLLNSLKEEEIRKILKEKEDAEREAKKIPDEKERIGTREKAGTGAAIDQDAEKDGALIIQSGKAVTNARLFENRMPSRETASEGVDPVKNPGSVGERNNRAEGTIKFIGTGMQRQDGPQ